MTCLFIFILLEHYIKRYVNTASEEQRCSVSQPSALAVRVLTSCFCHMILFPVP